MAAYQIGQFFGALIACGVVTGLLHAGASTWPASIGKAVFINIIAAIIEILLSAIGRGFSAASTPDFSDAPIYVVAQLIIVVVYFIRIRRSPRGEARASERRDSKF